MVAQTGAFPVSAEDAPRATHCGKGMNSGIFSTDAVEANLHADLAICVAGMTYFWAFRTGSKTGIKYSNRRTIAADDTRRMSHE